MINRNIHTYNAHETDRMLQLHGAPLASFKSRAAAFVLDFALAFLMFASILSLTARLAKLLKIPVEDANLKFDFGHWYSILFLVAYFALSVYWTNGRSIGKWLFRIKVVSLVHDRMTLWQSIERALGYGASFLEFGFGFVQFFIDSNRRTVHDRIADTIVVQDWKRGSKPVNLDQGGEGKLSSKR